MIVKIKIAYNMKWLSDINMFVSAKQEHNNKFTASSYI